MLLLCCARSLQPCTSLCNPMGCSPPGYSAHGTLLVRILEWVAMPSARGSSWPRTEPASLTSPALAGRLFTTHTTKILSNAFSESVEMILDFIFPFVNVKFHINWFANVELSCVLEKNPAYHGVWSFLYHWVWFATIVLRIFASIFIKGIGL